MAALKLSNHTFRINIMILNCLPIAAKNLRSFWALFKNNVPHNGIHGLDGFIQLCEYLCGGWILGMWGNYIVNARNSSSRRRRRGARRTPRRSRRWSSTVSTSLWITGHLESRPSSMFWWFLGICFTYLVIFSLYLDTTMKKWIKKIK